MCKGKLCSWLKKIVDFSRETLMLSISRLLLQFRTNDSFDTKQTVSRVLATINLVSLLTSHEEIDIVGAMSHIKHHFWSRNILFCNLNTKFAGGNNVVCERERGKGAHKNKEKIYIEREMSF